MKRKIVSILLTLCMTLSLLPTTALAAEKDTVVTEKGAVVTGVHNERVVIQAEDVSVKGAKLNGGLLIDEAASGTVTLSTDTIVAAIVISAEGVSVIIESKAEVKSIEVNAKAVTVSVEGKVETVTVAETAEAAAVTVAESATVKAVEINAPASTVEVQGKVETVTVGETAVGAAAAVAETATVKTVENNAPQSTVEVQGKVESMTVGETATGASTTVGETASVGKMDVKAEDTKLDVADGGTVGTVTSDKEIDVTGDGAGKVEVTPPAGNTGSATTPSEEPGTSDTPPIAEQPTTKTITIYATINGAKTAVGTRVVDANTNAVISDTIDSAYAANCKAVVAVSGQDLMAYNSLTTALTGMGESKSATIKVVGDITETGYVTIDGGKNVTLDLGTSTVTGKLVVNGGKADATAAVEGGAALTIRGSGTIKTAESDLARNVIEINDGGKVVMESGNIVARKGTDTGSAAQSSGGFAVTVLNGGDFTMSGGKIEAGWYAVSGNGTANSSAGNYGEGAKITITGGELISHGDVAVYAPAKGGVVNISGGKISGDWGALLARDGKITITGGSLTNLTGTGYTDVTGTPSKNWTAQTDGSEDIKGNPSVIIIPNYANRFENNKVVLVIKAGVQIDAGGVVVTNTGKTGATKLSKEQLEALVDLTDVAATVVVPKYEIEANVTPSNREANSAQAALFSMAREEAYKLGVGEFMQINTGAAAEMLKTLEADINAAILAQKEAGEKIDAPDVFKAGEVKLYWTKDGDGKDYIVLIGVSTDANGNEYSLPGQSVLVTVQVPEDYTGGAQELGATVTVTAKAPTVSAEIAAEDIAKAIEENAKANEALNKANEEKAAADQAAADAAAAADKAAADKAAAENELKAAATEEEKAAAQAKVDEAAKAEEAAAAAKTEADKQVETADKAVQDAETAKNDAVVEDQTFTEIASGSIDITVVLPGGETPAE